MDTDRSVTPTQNIALNVIPFTPCCTAQSTFEELLDTPYNANPESIILAPGCELIICGISTNKDRGDVIEVVQKSINELSISQPILKSIPVILKKFSPKFLSNQ